MPEALDLLLELQFQEVVSCCGYGGGVCTNIGEGENSGCAAQSVILPQSFNCWVHRHAPPHLAYKSCFKGSLAKSFFHILVYVQITSQIFLLNISFYIGKCEFNYKA